MSHTQNIFKTICSNNLIQSFQRYTTDNLKEMYLLNEEEAIELHYFIRQTYLGEEQEYR